MHIAHSARGKVHDTRKGRIKAIRTAAGKTQETFIPVLNEASRAVLGDGVRIYSQSIYSRIESGKQEPTFEDVVVLTSLDKEARGPLWLIWGDGAAEMFQPKVMPPAETKSVKRTKRQPKYHTGDKPAAKRKRSDERSA